MMPLFFAISLCVYIGVVGRKKDNAVANPTSSERFAVGEKEKKEEKRRQEGKGGPGKSRRWTRLDFMRRSLILDQASSLYVFHCRTISSSVRSFVFASSGASCWLFRAVVHLQIVSC